MFESVVWVGRSLAFVWVFVWVIGVCLGHWGLTAVTSTPTFPLQFTKSTYEMMAEEWLFRRRQPLNLALDGDLVDCFAKFQVRRNARKKDGLLVRWGEG